MPVRRLDEKALRYIVRQRGRRKAIAVAGEMDISERWVYRIWAHHKRTGKIPDPKRLGRPRAEPTRSEIRRVLEEHSRGSAGPVLLTKRMRAGDSKISYYKTYQIMKREGLVDRTMALSKRRKWVRYERKYSNAMWHVDWHIIKGNSCLKGRWLIAYLDDASRCITGYGVFENATTVNSIHVLRSAVKRFGAPAQMLSDNGAQFTITMKGRPRYRKRLNMFEQELADLGIIHIKTRVGHPQTNGKLERFFGTFGSGWEQFGNVPEYVSYYNEYRLHSSLDADAGETPRKAFANKKATSAIRKGNPKWFEEDMNSALQ